jgi:hypothetical protein
MNPEDSIRAALADFEDRPRWHTSATHTATTTTGSVFKRRQGVSFQTALTRKVCGVLVARLSGEKLVADPADRSTFGAVLLAVRTAFSLDRCVVVANESEAP